MIGALLQSERNHSKNVLIKKKNVLITWYHHLGGEVLNLVICKLVFHKQLLQC